MDYDLVRIDYTICGITLPDTLKILPPGPKTQQKFAVGDKNGVLQCLGIKDEEPVVQFKTLPGKPITSVQLAASTGTPSDKIFAAAGNEVKGYTRKGKVFLTVATPLSETITSMYVLGNDLVLGSGHIVTHYRDLRETHSYTCEDRVLDLAAFSAPNSARIRLLVLIANKSVLVFEGGQRLAKVTIQSGPTRLSVPPSLRNTEVCSFYGASDGSLGLIVYDGNEVIAKCLLEGQSLGSVMCMGWYYNSDVVHLAVGRHDGSIQLYLLDPDNLVDKPRLKFTYFCGEPVTSVCGGCVGTEGSELLAATFSGRIFALRSRRLLSSTAILANIPQEALAARRSKLEIEVAKLEKQAAIEREKYQRNTKTLSAGLSAPSLLDVECELTGAGLDGWQQAKIIAAVPLDILFIYCEHKLELQSDSAAVLSICPSMGSLLATVRCQAGTRRISLGMKFPADMRIQFKSTTVLVYALPACAPRVARALSIHLCALPFYSQHEDPMLIEVGNRIWCTFSVTGSFSVAEMTSWLSNAFPGDLPKPSASIHFARSHILLRTLLVCQYQKGKAMFRSEDISAAAKLRDILTNCSVSKNIRIEFAWDIPEDCCVKHFELIEKMLVEEHQKKRDITLGKAIAALDLDLSVVDGQDAVLCADYLRVLKYPTEDDKTNISEIVAAVIAWAKVLKEFSFTQDTINSTDKISTLKENLEQCNLNNIKAMLKSSEFSSTM